MAKSTCESTMRGAVGGRRSSGSLSAFMRVNSILPLPVKSFESSHPSKRRLSQRLDLHLRSILSLPGGKRMLPSIFSNQKMDRPSSVMSSLPLSTRRLSPGAFASMRLKTGVSLSGIISRESASDFFSFSFFFSGSSILISGLSTWSPVTRTRPLKRGRISG